MQPRGSYQQHTEVIEQGFTRIDSATEPEITNIPKVLYFDREYLWARHPRVGSKRPNMIPPVRAYQWERYKSVQTSSKPETVVCSCQIHSDNVKAIIDIGGVSTHSTFNFLTADHTWIITLKFSALKKQTNLSLIHYVSALYSRISGWHGCKGYFGFGANNALKRCQMCLVWVMEYISPTIQLRQALHIWHYIQKQQYKIGHRPSVSRQASAGIAYKRELTKREEVATHEAEQGGPKRGRRHHAFASIATDLQSK